MTKKNHVNKKIKSDFSVNENAVKNICEWQLLEISDDFIIIKKPEYIGLYSISTV